MPSRLANFIAQPFQQVHPVVAGQHPGIGDEHGCVGYRQLRFHERHGPTNEQQQLLPIPCVRGGIGFHDEIPVDPGFLGNFA